MSRQIEPALVAIIDERLKLNGMAQEAIRTQAARPLLILVAQCLIGVREKTGNNDGTLVELMQETVGEHSHESWCMSYVQSCIAYVEKKLGVVSPVAASEHCLTVWRDTKKSQRVKLVPAPGAIVVWQHGVSEKGHTGFMLEWRASKFAALEGNTEAGVAGGEVVREGGGTYVTDRGAFGNGSMKVLGFLKPF